MEVRSVIENPKTIGENQFDPLEQTQNEETNETRDNQLVENANEQEKVLSC